MAHSIEYILRSCGLAALLWAVALTGFSSTVGNSMTTRDCASDDRFRSASLLLAQGNTALAASNYAQANLAFNAGIVELGKAYYSGPVLDDTGMNLGLAQTEEQRGHLELAANLRKGVLESRLVMYKSAHCQVSLPKT